MGWEDGQGIKTMFQQTNMCEREERRIWKDQLKTMILKGRTVACLRLLLQFLDRGKRYAKGHEIAQLLQYLQIDSRYQALIPFRADGCFEGD